MANHAASIFLLSVCAPRLRARQCPFNYYRALCAIVFHDRMNIYVTRER